MSNQAELSQAIATVERQISEAKSEVAKKSLNAKLERLKEELKSGAKKGTSTLATLSSARKSVRKLASKDFTALIEKLSKKPEYAFLKGYSEGKLKDDLARVAKPMGYRFVGDNTKKPTIPQIKKGLKDGTVYYEARPIRSDVSRVVQLGEGGRIDLFEDYENIPANIQEILDKYSDAFGGDGSDMDYKDTANMLKEFEAEGYTFDYGLDNEPFGLRPIGVKLNELRDYEDFDDDKMATGGGVEGCIDYIKNSESIKNNGYYLHINSLNKYVDSGAKIPKIKPFCLITFNSGGQKNLKAIDTINATLLSSEIAKLLNIDIELARIIVSEQTTRSKRFTMDMLDKIKNNNIIVADRETIVCTNLSNKFAEGGTIDNSYLGRTSIGKSFYGWKATTSTTKQIKGYDWEITTMKRYGGELVSTATGGKSEKQDGYSTFEYSPFEDPNYSLIRSKPKMVNEKAVTKQHEEALKIFIEKMNEMSGEIMATGGLIVNNDKDLKEVAEYMTTAVKKHRWDLKDLIYYFEKENGYDYTHRVKIWEDMNGYEMKKTYENIYEMLKRIVEANGKKMKHGGSVKVPIKVKKRLEAIRKSIQNENVSYGEMAELQSLSKYIDPSDIELRESAGMPEFEDEDDKMATGGLIVNNDKDLKEVAEYMTTAVKKHRWDLKDLIYYFEKENGYDYTHRVKIWEDMNGYEMKKTYENIYEMLKRIVEANGKKMKHGGSVKVPIKVKKRLEAIRKSIQNENVSYGELAELQNLSQYIDPSDVELREAAGMPEFDDDDEMKYGGKSKSQSTKSIYIETIAGKTGLRTEAIETFVSENNLSDKELLNLVQGIGTRKLESNDLISAVVGIKGNKKISNVVAFAKSDKAFSKMADGGTLEDNLLPPSKTYGENLAKAMEKFDISNNEARKRYGLYTIKQWSELLGEKMGNGGEVGDISKSEIPRMQKITKLKGLYGYMPSVNAVYYDSKSDKFYFQDFEGDYMELRNISTLEQLDKFLKENNITLDKKMATGGSIPDNYEGRTPEDIWNSLSKRQRQHFLYDHISEIETYKNTGELPSSEIIKAYNSEWSTLDKDIKNRFTNHTREGQYATGGSVGGKKYSYLPNEDISKIVLKSKQVIGEDRILDGAYIKSSKPAKKANDPEMERAMAQLDKLKNEGKLIRYLDVRGNGKKTFDILIPNKEEKGYWKRYESASRGSLGTLQNEMLSEEEVLNYILKTQPKSSKSKTKELYNKFDAEKQTIALGIITDKVAEDFMRDKFDKTMDWEKLSDKEKEEYNREYKSKLEDFTDYLLAEFLELYYGKESIREKCKGTSRKTIDAIESVLRNIAKEYPEEKYATGGGVDTDLHGKFGDDNPKLVNFDIDDLDQYEEMVYNDMKKSNTKAATLQVIINTVEGDYTQLSPELAEIAEEQFTSDEWDEESNKRYFAKGGGVSPYYGGMSEAEILKATVVYDNGGETLDRYTVFTPDSSVFGMSATGDGFNQYIGDDTEIEKGSHLGKRLKTVPKDIKSAVLNRMIEEEFGDGGSMYKKGGNTGYAYGNHEYKNSFGIEQKDFKQIVDAYYNSYSENQYDRTESRMTFSEMREKYGEGKVDEVGEYIAENYKSKNKMAKGGNTGYAYVPNADIEKIVGKDGKEYGQKMLLDGAYVKDKVRTPKMSRTQFEDDVYAYGEGGEIERNKKNNDWNSMFNFYTKYNSTPVTKGNLIKMAYKDVNGVDSAIPQSIANDVDDTFYYVYDYQEKSFGELVDLRKKLKFSNNKVDVTIAIDGDVIHGKNLPAELEDATFHQALAYVFKHDEVEAFDIRPKTKMATGGAIEIRKMKKEKEKMVSELFEKCGVFFAFSEKQFEENKTPLKEGEKYVSIGGGGYLPKGKVNELTEGMEAIERFGKQTVKKKNLVEAEILDELQNHECFYTGDISDVVDLFEGTYTKQQIRDVYNKHREANQEYALGGEITAEERDQALKNSPKLNF